MKYLDKTSFAGWVKRIFSLLGASGMVIATIMGAMAFSIDADDNYYLTKDTQLKGTFVVSGIDEGTTLKSNMEWISLEEGKYISEKPSDGTRLVDDNFVFPYYISVPDDADIGIYRGTIEVENNGQVEYLNVKISVQNGLVTSITKSLHNPKQRLPIIIAFCVILMIFFILSFRRAKNVSKR